MKSWLSTKFCVELMAMDNYFDDQLLSQIRKHLRSRTRTYIEHKVENMTKA